MDMAVRGRLFYYTDIGNMAQRVTFYIDGFNFYYGLRRTKRNEPQWGDCVLDATDTIVLVSADSDLVPPWEFIQRQYPEKRIKVYFPPSNFSCDLKDNLMHHSSKPPTASTRQSNTSTATNTCTLATC